MHDEVPGDQRWGGALMVCGTASDVGKSHLVTGLCRLLARRGVRVAPFKAQNMSLNSYVTADGHEIGRAQATQAMAAGLEPEAAMNPVLLKPSGPATSQVVVMGRPVAELTFDEYRDQAGWLREVVIGALAALRARFDVVICEGAGGAAEINLLDRDIVNLPLAADAGVPAIVVGDIERGGVFASLYGTVALLGARHRSMIKGFVINKFCGDPESLRAGTDELERRSGVPTLGVVPWVDGVELDAEDSVGLHGRWARPDTGPGDEVLDVAVIGFPHLSNVTDLDALANEPGVIVRLVTSSSIGEPDVLVLPGTKSTVCDLEWMRRCGLDRAITAAARRAGGPVVVGICGGYQMLGRVIEDEVESREGRVPGLALLDTATTFETTKVLRRRRGTGWGAPVAGYEIHHGRTRRTGSDPAWIRLDDAAGAEDEGSRSVDGRIVGTSLHGLFDEDGFRAAFLRHVAGLRRKPFMPRATSFRAAREAQHDRLADAVEAHLDLGALAAIMAGGAPPRPPSRGAS